MMTQPISSGQLLTGGAPQAGSSDDPGQGAEILAATFGMLISQLMGNGVQPNALPTTQDSRGAASDVRLPVAADPGIPVDPASSEKGEHADAKQMNSKQAVGEDILSAFKDAVAAAKAGTNADKETAERSSLFQNGLTDPEAAPQEKHAGTGPQTAPVPQNAGHDTGDFKTADAFSPLLQQTAGISGTPLSVAPAAGSAVPHSAPTAGAASADRFDGMTAISGNGTRLAVTLEPDGLGKMQINLSLDRGVVNAHINVADQSLRSIIENRSHEIVSALLQEGISVGGFSVSLRGGGQGSDRQQDGFSDAPEQAPQLMNIASVGSVTSMQANGLVSIFV